jgi:DNA-binding NtrC family response regulator
VTPEKTSAESKPDLPELADSLGTVADALLDRGFDLSDALKVFEARYLKAAVARHEGNLSRAASVLGIHRNTLRGKLQRNGHRRRARR